MAEYIIVKNAKTSKQYILQHFNSYMVDQSLDIPADAFSFAIGDPNYQVSSTISSGDELMFYVDDKLVLDGLIDNMEIIGDIQGGTVIDLQGRDKSSILLDNDAMPITLYQLNIKQYLDKYIKPYGFTKFVVDDLTSIDKIVIGTGESEWGILANLCKKKGIIPRYDIDSLICTKLRADTKMDYLFSNDSNPAIKIKNYRISTNSDIKSEVLVISTQYGRNHKVTSKDIKASAKDTTLKIKKRLTMSDNDLESAAEALKVAKAELMDTNRGAFVISLECHTEVPIFINKVAHVIIQNIGLDCYMITNKVTYTKDKKSGSVTKVELKLMENVPVVWGNHNIPTIKR